jgi:cobalamin biosynthesis protein CobW
MMKKESIYPVSSIPALVVSGFLGAGKTTLVRYLLKEAQREGVRLAVVSNEFGALGIDQALLGSQGSNFYVELEGGCVCCKLSDELVDTLQQLWEEVRPDRIVVETSGVALPFDTLINFWREPVSQWVSDSLAVVVVNAEQVGEGRDLEGTFEQQVSSADFVILNKIDLVEVTQWQTIEQELEKTAPGTPIIRTINGNVASEILFAPAPSSRVKRLNDAQQPHTHEAFESEELILEPGLAPETIIKHLQSYQSLRAKGFVQTSQGPRLLQGVGTRIDLVESSVSPPAHLLGRIVIIRRSTESDSRHN